jgi:hypothetical protein
MRTRSLRASASREWPPPWASSASDVTRLSTSSLSDLMTGPDLASGGVTAMCGPGGTFRLGDRPPASWRGPRQEPGGPCHAAAFNDNRPAFLWRSRDADAHQARAARFSTLCVSSCRRRHGRQRIGDERRRFLGSRPAHAAATADGRHQPARPLATELRSQRRPGRPGGRVPLPWSGKHAPVEPRRRDPGTHREGDGGTIRLRLVGKARHQPLSVSRLSLTPGRRPGADADRGCRVRACSE